jgi:hypothetical protein
MNAETRNADEAILAQDSNGGIGVRPSDCYCSPSTLRGYYCG